MVTKYIFVGSMNFTRTLLIFTLRNVIRKKKGVFEVTGTAALMSLWKRQSHR